VSTIGSLFQERLVVYSTPDLDDYALTIGEMFDEFDLYVGLDDEELGWSKLLDVDLCPPLALPYLGQFIGERVPPDLETTDSDAAREWVADRPNSRRGTNSSIVGVARRNLSGSRVVAVRERDGDADHIAIRTLAAETLNATLIQQELRREAVPADIVMDYQIFTGTTLADLDAGFATYGAITGYTLGELSFLLVGYTIHTL